MATVFLKEEFLQCSFIAAIDLLASTPFIPLNDLHYLTHEKLHSQQQSAFTPRKRKSFSLFPWQEQLLLSLSLLLCEAKTTTSILMSPQFGSRSNKSQIQKATFFSNLPTLFQALSFVHPLKSFMLSHSSQQGGERKWSSTRTQFKLIATLNVVCH